MQPRFALRTWRQKLTDSAPLTRLVLVLFLTALGTTHCAPMTWNDESRMATIQALVESHSFVIDQTSFESTGDKVYIDGHFYSDKPPLPSLLGAIAYAPLHLFGLRLGEGGSAAYFLITLCTVGVIWAFGTLAFFHSLAFAGLDQERRLLAAIVLGMGTLYLSWSTTFNNHEMSAGFLSVGFFFFLRSGRTAFVRGNIFLAGCFFSLAGAADIPTSIFYVLFLGNVACDSTRRKAVPYYLLPLAATVVPTLAIDYSIHHNIMPVQIYRSYFEYMGSPWIGSAELSGLEMNDWRFSLGYAFRTLLGPKGFLLYNPFLIVAVVYLVREIRRRGVFFREAISVAVGSIVLMSYYWTTTNNYGGWSYSMRWFVPLVPLLFFFAFPFFQIADLRRSVLFQTLLCLSIVIAFVGALNPWSPVIYSDISFVANIRQFVEHMRHPKYILMQPSTRP